MKNNKIKGLQIDSVALDESKYLESIDIDEYNNSKDKTKIVYGGAMQSKIYSKSHLEDLKLGIDRKKTKILKDLVFQEVKRKGGSNITPKKKKRKK